MVRPATLLAALLIYAPIAAQAQTAPSAPAAPNPACPPGANRAPNPGSGNLSEDLARSGGVICPPTNVDPDIHRPAPERGGPMPVIPPPGSPGGDPNVQPK